MGYGTENVNQLNGLTVKYIDVSEDAILITTECDKKFQFDHYQDCCENVRIVDSKGDLQTLKGQKLVNVEIDTAKDIPSDVDIEPYDSYTWTEITFKTTDETIISRWIGESNGYYSESVDLSELSNE